MTQKTPRTIDPVSLTMYWNKLLAIVDEATVTLLRTAFSRVVTDSWDFSCALFDVQGEMIAQGRHGLPSFIGCLALAVKDFLHVYPPEQLEPGDTLMTTDPWIGASQINDVFLVTPIFYNGRIVAYAANVSHSPDVGGRLLSAESSEIFEEGFRLPVVKLFRRGEPNEDLFRIIRLNVRVPDIVVGDLLAQLASNQIMARRITEFLEEKQLDDLEALAAEITDRSEVAIRRALTAIPQGIYHGELETDGFDRPILLKLALTVDEDGVLFDFTGSSPQDEHGVNCVWRYAYAELCHAVICVARPSSPVNGITLRPFRFFAPEGTIVNPMYPAALGARAMISMFMGTLVFRTLAQTVPSHVIADSHSPPHISAFMGSSRTGRRYVETMLLNGGLGARPTMDGVNALGWPANISTVQLEVTENEKPLQFLRKELLTDTCGAGRFRGGMSQCLEVRSQAPDPISVAMRLDRVHHPPLGLFGGRPGASALATINGQPIHPKKIVRLARGDVFRVQVAGAGGYGDPQERDPRKVLEDVLDEYLSPEQARRDYLLVVDTDQGVIDWEATRKLRGETSSFDSPSLPT
ncbi:MAG: hydantoinase B/oxoprolinase family protein [Chloroflexi bacterium]|nr:hydantoinase B/oxoprolinase family protein [Chloroflexota bacterium]